MPIPSSIVGDAYTSRRAGETLERLTDIDQRAAGLPGEAAAAALLVETFEDAGFDDVGTSEFEIPGWRRGSSALTVRGDAPTVRGDTPTVYEDSHELIALPRSVPGEVTGRLVDLDAGVPSRFAETDLEGTVVLVSSHTPEGWDRWIHRTEKYNRAVEAGADGFVFANRQSGCLPATGNVGGPESPGPIPAVGVSMELGERLSRRCARGEPTVTLETTCTNEPATSRTVHGAVGPDTDDEILLTAHMDAHDISEGATDNAVGCAIVSEVGRLLGRVESDLGTRVRLVTFGSEEIGLRGSHAWASERDLDRVKTVINVDGAGSSRDIELSSNGHDDVADVFTEVAGEFGVPIEVDDGLSPWSDHWPFVQRGVPGVLVSSRSEGTALRGWGHTHGDTLDKVDTRDLRDLIVVLTGTIVELSDPDRTVERTSSDEVRRAAIDEGHAEGLRMRGEWPWSDR